MSDASRGGSTRTNDAPIGGLPLPKRLLALIDSGLWPTTSDEERRQNIQSLISRERIQHSAPEQDRIYFFRPPFRTIAQRMNGAEKAFWSKWGALSDIAPDLALDLGDFGLGADSAIALDYRYDNPPVIRLVWRKPEPNTWIRCADTFDQFADMLGLDSESTVTTITTPFA
jgi:hypothetical protein